MQFQIYKDVQNHWRWRLLAANHKTIADSGESYWNRDDCLKAIALVKSSAAAPVYEV